MKFKIAAVIFLLGLCVSGIHAMAKDAFLCMRPEENVAVTIDENKNCVFTEMRASNGALVSPQLSKEGVTYLPLRYICEAAGLTEAPAGVDMPESSFRYNPLPDGQYVEIRSGGQYYVHKLGDYFSYDDGSGVIKTGRAVNVDGTVYIPMGYIAKLTNGQVFYNDKWKKISFLSGSLNHDDYLDAENDLRFDRRMYMEYEFYSNNLTGSTMYLATDGLDIRDLKDETAQKPRSISRSGNRLYYLNEAGTVMTKTERQPDEAVMQFYDENGNGASINAVTVFVCRNKIYGIQAESGNSGRLFQANLDGTQFVYLTNDYVYNLIMRKRDEVYYLYYCEAATKATIHMIDTRTMDNYTIELTNYSHVNVLDKIKQFVVGDRIVATIDEAGTLRVFRLDDCLEDFEIQRVWDENYLTFWTTPEGYELNNITAMNFDYTNNVLYISATTEDFSASYYYTLQNNCLKRLETSDYPITDVALFKNLGDWTFHVKIVNGGWQMNHLAYYDGNVVFEDE